MHDPVLDALMTSIESRQSVALVMVTKGEGVYADAVGARAVMWPQPDRPPVGDLRIGELSAQAQADVAQVIRAKEHGHLDYATADGRVSLFVEVQGRPPHLIIVGAGHIAVPLAAMAKICDFQVTVLDDRAMYATSARFPTADQVIAGPFVAELQKLRQGRPTFDDDTYIVLVTRGHQYDIASLLEVLDDPLAYIGMIGSKRRIRAVYQLLEQEQGIPAHKFQRIHAPIGLPLGARTPAEIAVCIMAEIIGVMRQGDRETRRQGD